MAEGPAAEDWGGGMNILELIGLIVLAIWGPSLLVVLAFILGLMISPRFYHRCVIDDPTELRQPPCVEGSAIHLGPDGVVPDDIYRA